MPNEALTVFIAEFIEDLKIDAGNYSKLAALKETDIGSAALALADEYSIDNPVIMKTILELYAFGGLDLVRRKLRENRLG